MRNVFLIMLVLVVSVFALDDKSVPNTFSDGDTIEAADFNANFDTLEIWIVRTNDSLELRFIRFADLTGGDSTLSRIQLDTIRSNPDVDTLLGRPHIDTLETNYIVVNDSCKITGHVKVTQDVTADSLVALTGARVTNDLSVSNDATADSLIGTTGIRSGNDVLAGADVTATNDVTGDSLIGTTGIRSGADVLAGDMRATDSITAAGGMTVGTDLVVTDDAKADSFICVSGIPSPNNVLVGNDLYADSVIASTGARVGNALTAVDVTASGTVTADQFGFGTNQDVTLSTDTVQSGTASYLEVFSQTGKVDTLRVIKTANYNFGDIIIVTAENGDSIVVKDNTTGAGTLNCAGNVGLEERDYLMLIFDSIGWQQISYTDN